MSISYKLIHFICLTLLVYIIVSVCTCHWRMTTFCIQHVFKNQTIEQWVSVTIQERYCIAVLNGYGNVFRDKIQSRDAMRQTV